MPRAGHAGGNSVGPSWVGTGCSETQGQFSEAVLLAWLRLPSLSLVLSIPPALLLIYWRRNAHLGCSHEKGILGAAALQWMGSLGGFSRWFLRCGRKSIRWMLAAYHVEGGCVCLTFGFILLLALEIKASCSLTLLPSPAVLCLWPFITNLADNVKCLNKPNHKDYSNPEVNCPETSNSSLTYCAIHTTSFVAIPAFHRAQKRETFTQLREDRGKQEPGGWERKPGAETELDGGWFELSFNIWAEVSFCGKKLIIIFPLPIVRVNSTAFRAGIICFYWWNAKHNARLTSAAASEYYCNANAGNTKEAQGKELLVPSHKLRAAFCFHR